MIAAAGMCMLVRVVLIVVVGGVTHGDDLRTLWIWPGKARMAGRPDDKPTPDMLTLATKCIRTTFS